MAKLLYDDKLAPITSEIGFLQCDAETAASEFYKWQTIIRLQYKQTLEMEDMSAECLESLLPCLLPLTSVLPVRYLFVPTRGKWTAYFDNGWQGGEQITVVSVLAEKIGCLGIRAVWIPNTKRGRKGRYGAVIFTVYDQPNPILNILRSVSLVNDGNWSDKWDFDTSGEAFPFEQVERYKAHRIVDRFTPDMLDSYLKELGIDAFSEDFYLTTKENPAKLITIKGKIPKNVKKYSLKSARKDF